MQDSQINFCSQLPGWERQGLQNSTYFMHLNSIKTFFWRPCACFSCGFLVLVPIRNILKRAYNWSNGRHGLIKMLLICFLNVYDLVGGQTLSIGEAVLLCANIPIPHVHYTLQQIMVRMCAFLRANPLLYHLLFHYMTVSFMIHLGYLKLG